MLAPSHGVALRSTTMMFALRAVLLLLSCLFGSAALADNAPTPANYRLAAGDTIRITIFQNPDMNLETRVSEDGTINYPLIGGIVIGNLEIGAAERKVAKSLKDGGFLKEPQVNIQLLEIRGNVVSVLGQVNHAGSFPLLTTNTRVSQLLAQAGGVLSTGDDRVVVTGARDGKPFRLSIDIDALYRGQDPVDDFVVAGGDSIYVPRAPLFYIYGEITKPGSYRIERNMTVRQAIAAGGGLTLRGTERRLRVVRPTAQGEQSGKQPIELDELVRPDDVIYVNESLF